LLVPFFTNLNKLYKNAAPKSHFAEPNSHVLTFLHPILICRVMSEAPVESVLQFENNSTTHPPTSKGPYVRVVYIVARTFELEKTSVGTRGSQSLEQAKTSMRIRGGSIVVFRVCNLS
jgi:hypothetical protein